MSATLDDIKMFHRRVAALEGEAHNARGKKAASLLLAGSLLGLLGFSLAVIIGVLKYRNRIDYDGRSYLSGHGFFPASVSEIVHDYDEDPAGVLFWGVTSVGAVMLFMSWYGFELRNAYIGDDRKLPCIAISWGMCRQYLPVPGMMLFVNIPLTGSYPITQANLIEFVCVTAHCLGKLCMCVGYMAVEAHSLAWGPCWYWTEPKLKIEWTEDRARRLLLTFMFIAFCLHSVCFFMYESKVDVCCADQYAVLDLDQPSAKPFLKNTASGRMLGIKIIAYCAEISCGLLFMSSHFCVWYFCKERQIDLCQELHPLVPAVDEENLEERSSSSSRPSTT